MKNVNDLARSLKLTWTLPMFEYIGFTRVVSMECADISPPSSDVRFNGPLSAMLCGQSLTQKTINLDGCIENKLGLYQHMQR